jgi:site-specific DNA-methyltransferase (adenine-specific)
MAWRVFHASCVETTSAMKPDSVDVVVTDPPYGLSFMGKDWDKAVPPVDWWKAIFRVMKPGAFAAVLCTPRQDCQARMVTNLEEAGFITGFTSIMWTYATGFPKAGNLSKLADKRAGAKREIIGSKAGMPGYSLAESKGHLYGGGFGGAGDPVRECEITAAATAEAKALDGAYAGFQPKPAFEPILIVMKPLAHGTYLDQALDNGKGCSWLDDGRIPAKGRPLRESGNRPGFADVGVSAGSRAAGETNVGRFPANVLCCDDALDDGRKRKTNSTGKKPPGAHPRDGLYGDGIRGGSRTYDSDAGSYSRYFDLDRWFAERVKQLPEEVQHVFPWLIVPKPSKREKGADNKHPTVKPLKLMSYLVTLFSRPGDLVLDPFTGSGTTGVAATLLKRRFIGCDTDEESVETARKRIGEVDA